MAGIGKADGSVRRRTLRVTLSHVVAVGRQMRRRRKAQPRRDSLLQRLFPPNSTNQTAAVAVPAQEAAGPDPVKIAALAIDGVARASMRACFSGSEIAVAAPD